MFNTVYAELVEYFPGKPLPLQGIIVAVAVIKVRVSTGLKCRM